MTMTNEQVAALVAGEPSAKAWQALCGALAARDGAALGEALALVRGPLAKWPADVRRLGNWYPDRIAVPWIESLLGAGVDVDPRLALAAVLTVELRCGYDPAATTLPMSLQGLTLQLARLFDPTFDPPDIVLHKDAEFTSAAGCGGGFDEEKRGDEQSGLVWYNRCTEHAADYSDDGGWTPYGLPAGLDFRVGRWERTSGFYTLNATGRTQAVIAIVRAWSRVMRDAGLRPEAGFVSS